MILDRMDLEEKIGPVNEKVLKGKIDPDGKNDNEYNQEEAGVKEAHAAGTKQGDSKGIATDFEGLTNIVHELCLSRHQQAFGSSVLYEVLCLHRLASQFLKLFK